MCRIAFLPKKVVQNQNQEKIKEFLSHLEKMQGGHGNGIGFVSGNEINVYKGVKVTISEIVEKMYQNDPINGYLFHTRRANIGKKDDTNTHPHVDKNNILMLVHNGRWSEYTKYSNEFNEYEYEKTVAEIPVYSYSESIFATFKKKIEKIETFIKREKYSDSYVMTQVLGKKIMENLNDNNDIETAADKAVEWLYGTLLYDAVIAQLKNGITYLVTKKPVEVGYVDGAVVIASQSLWMLRAENVKDFKGIIKIYNGDKGEMKIMKEEHYYYHSWYSDNYNWLSKYSESKYNSEKDKKEDNDLNKLLGGDK